MSFLTRILLNFQIILLSNNFNENALLNLNHSVWPSQQLVLCRQVRTNSESLIWQTHNSFGPITSVNSYDFQIFDFREKRNKIWKNMCVTVNKRTKHGHYSPEGWHEWVWNNKMIFFDRSKWRTFFILRGNDI